ncbi:MULTISPECIES: cobalt transporter CbiM [Dickeya]|uniref:Substrate-specific component NikM of nickel ECF transporter n=1 Tax=Dickeya aquatica TaxID=1401087 RepID=A0A375AAY8_9GAMM|nr:MULTISPECIES: cobalt transporter CbiM [Dickeya]SLM62759.1 Substrate-specific component NikM of nickel ECF transporter [Dickeya aquatica]
MAHIPDGLLSLPILVSDGIIAITGVGLALRRINDRAIPRIAILSAVFFTASLVSMPVGPSSIHLLLSGLMGIVLGMGIFPAVMVALFLQAILFGFGGLTTLGVNTVNIALPGAIVGLVLGPVVRHASSAAKASSLAALGAAFSVMATGGLVAISLWISSSAFTPVAKILLITYLPLALVDAAFTAAVVGFLTRVKPQALIPQLSSPE